VGIYRKYLFIILLALLPVVSHAQATLININTAGSDGLQTLNGIGPAYAQRIIDYRNANGLFEKIEDIKKVSGIGEITFSKIKDFITVGSPDTTTSATTTAATTEETTATSPSSSNQGSSSSGSSSAHYSAAPLSSLKILPGFEVSAGRDRLGTVGSPLEFKVETNIEYTKNSIFVWNFGDGREGGGEVVSHTYMYPGEYVLVLNVAGPRGKAVSRVNIKIVSPELAIANVSRERIEIANHSKSEASLFGRALVTRDKVFAFPRDTIIKAGQKISFDGHITGLNPFGPTDVSLLVVGTEIKLQEVLAKIEEQRLGQVTRIQSQLSILREQLAGISNQQNSANATTAAVASSIIEELVEPENNESQTALVISAVIPETSSNTIGGWLQTLKRFFFRTQ